MKSNIFEKVNRIDEALKKKTPLKMDLQFFADLGDPLAGDHLHQIHQRVKHTPKKSLRKLSSNGWLVRKR